MEGREIEGGGGGERGLGVCEDEHYALYLSSKRASAAADADAAVAAVRLMELRMMSGAVLLSSHLVLRRELQVCLKLNH